MAPREMKAYMEAQKDMIVEAYRQSSDMMTLGDFAVQWIDVNARVFRETYCVERDA